MATTPFPAERVRTSSSVSTGDDELNGEAGNDLLLAGNGDGHA